MTGKAPKAWALPRFWVSIPSYKKQLVKKILGRILGLAWLKFTMAVLIVRCICLRLWPGSVVMCLLNIFIGQSMTLEQSKCQATVPENVSRCIQV